MSDQDTRCQRCGVPARPEDLREHRAGWERLCPRCHGFLERIATRPWERRGEEEDEP